MSLFEDAFKECKKEINSVPSNSLSEAELMELCIVSKSIEYHSTK